MEKKIAEILGNFTEAAKNASDSAAVEKLRVSSAKRAKLPNL